MQRQPVEWTDAPPKRVRSVATTVRRTLVRGSFDDRQPIGSDVLRLNAASACSPTASAAAAQQQDQARPRSDSQPPRSVLSSGPLGLQLCALRNRRAGEVAPARSARPADCLLREESSRSTYVAFLFRTRVDQEGKRSVDERGKGRRRCSAVRKRTSSAPSSAGCEPRLQGRRSPAQATNLRCHPLRSFASTGGSSTFLAETGTGMGL